jgi:hypothetical protein
MAVAPKITEILKGAVLYELCSLGTSTIVQISQHSLAINLLQFYVSCDARKGFQAFVLADELITKLVFVMHIFVDSDMELHRTPVKLNLATWARVIASYFA